MTANRKNIRTGENVNLNTPPRQVSLLVTKDTKYKRA